MILEIKDVAVCRNGAYGNFVLRGRASSLITVSLKRNPSLAEYSATLIHELLHLFFTLLRYKGFRITDKLEHKVIYEFEGLFIKAFKKYVRDGKAIPATKRS